MANYYNLLGVPKNATPDELRDAFRKKALENHPDRISHLPEDEQNKRRELMYQVNEAYGTLSKPEKRKAYDRSVEQSTPPPGLRVLLELKNLPPQDTTISFLRFLKVLDLIVFLQIKEALIPSLDNNRVKEKLISQFLKMIGGF